MFHTYILQSLKDNKYYIGSTGNLEQRIKAHNLGHSRATKNRIPFKLIYSEEFESKSVAMKRENQIKSYKGGEAFKKLIRKVI